MKYFFFCFFGLLFFQGSRAQQTSESFTVSGEVLKAETIGVAALSPTDPATGRRYVKWLNRIIIHRQKT